LTRFYRLTPMDVERMTFREVSEYVTQMQRYQSEEARAHG
jgi:hypothetical protein